MVHTYVSIPCTVDRLAAWRRAAEHHGGMAAFYKENVDRGLDLEWSEARMAEHTEQAAHYGRLVQAAEGR